MSIIPKVTKLIRIRLPKEIFLKNLGLSVDKLKGLRSPFQKQKKFEGIVNEDRIKIRLIGGLKRIYRVEVLGHFLTREGKLYLQIEMKMKKFIMIYILIWMFLLLIIAIVMLNEFILSSEVPVLLFVFLPLLFIIYGLIINYIGFKNEAYKIVEILRDLSEGDLEYAR